jgi:predicted mannosyl-3-phosphoglycerate phosphatase (HAD superfamily)
MATLTREARRHLTHEEQERFFEEHPDMRDLRARHIRRRNRWLTVGVLALTTAVVAFLAIVLWPGTDEATFGHPLIAENGSIVAVEHQGTMVEGHPLIVENGSIVAVEHRGTMTENHPLIVENGSIVAVEHQGTMVEGHPLIVENGSIVAVEHRGTMTENHPLIAEFGSIVAVDHTIAWRDA